MKRYIKASVLGILDSDEDTQVDIASTTDNPEVLSDLSNSVFDSVKIRVAQNPNTPLDVLNKLSRSKERVGVREAVAQNPNISETIMWRLLKDKGGYVSYILQHSLHDMKNLSADTIQQLLSDTSSAYLMPLAIRESVARSLNTPVPVLMQLLKTKDANSDRAYMLSIQNPNFPAEKIRELYKQCKSKSTQYNNNVLYAISRSPNVSSDILMDLWNIGNSRGWQLQFNIMENPNCPESHIRKVYNSKYWRNFELNISQNPNCPVDILEDLLERTDDNDVKNNIYEQLSERGLI